MVAPMLVLAANPVQAVSNIQISDVQIEPTEGGFELKLEAQSGETAPQIFTANRGNALVADILNAQLNLPEAGFRQENPVPGIVAVEVNQLGDRNIQVVIQGESGAPVGQVLHQEANSIVLAVAPGPEASQTDSSTPDSAQLTAEASEPVSPAPALESKTQPEGIQPSSEPAQPNSEQTAPTQIAQAQPPAFPVNPGQQVPTFVNPGVAQPVPAPQPYVIPSQDPNVLVPNPGITVNGNPVAQSQAPGVLVPETQFNIDGTLAPPAMPLQPTAPAPPFLPRAVAPPVGDIAVSGLNTAPTIIDLGTALKVDSLILKDAPVREVLSFLARSAGLNLVFAESVGQADGEAGAQALGNISLDLEDESVQDAFNYVLQLSGLEANRRNRTIIVGAALPQGARSLVARSFRLNQVEAGTAATFLATQGASVQILEQQENNIIDPETQRIVRTERQPAQIRTLSAGAGEEGASGPLLLRGLSVSTDERLNVLTMVGEPRKIEIATSLLTQLDARVRQVALNVKIVDVNLLGQDAINSSFSFSINDGFLAVDDGAIFYSYGPFNPPDLRTQIQPSLTSIPTITNPFAGANTFLDLGNTTPIPGTAPGTVIIDSAAGTLRRIDPSGALNFINRVAGIATDPFVTGITDFTLATDNVITINPGTPPTTSVTQGTLGTATAGLPSLFQFPRRFLANLQASIQSRNAKILSDPTLVVQEGQEATVKLTQQVVGNIKSETESTGQQTTRTVTAEIVEAGLSLTINVERIDDNGFITLSVAPKVASIGANQNLNLGGGDDNTIALLNVREVSSGLLRLRDGQTLILAGIIQDAERTTIDKVPLLGDIPILGALFRRTQTDNERREVIVLLTPQILDDSDRFGGFGYNYNPGRATRDALQRTGVQVPGGR
jgi:type IV pilus assembly protein PilQ